MAASNMNGHLHLTDVHQNSPASLQKNVPEHLKVCHIWLIKFLKNMFSYIFINIIQVSLFSSEYLPFYF